MHNEAVHLRGETLPEQQQIFCVKVVSCPLSMVDLFRSFLEEAAFRLTQTVFDGLCAIDFTEGTGHYSTEKIPGRYICIGYI